MMLLGPLTNWEPHGVTLAGYCYAIRHGMKVQIVTLYRVSHLQRYGITVRGNVTSVYPPSDVTICSLTGTNILEESSDSTFKVGSCKHCIFIPPDSMVLYPRLTAVFRR
jgi:hypothetical protein